MKYDEMKTRWEELHSHVITQTAQAFVNMFLTRCVRAHTEHSLNDLSEVPALDMSRVLPRWKHSKKRLLLGSYPVPVRFIQLEFCLMRFIVDFEGTLWKRDLTKEGLTNIMKGDFEFPEEALDILKRLAEDKSNEVWLLSGLQVKGILDRVAEKIPKLGIV